MPEDQIKSGPQVVQDFLAAMETNTTIDRLTLETVARLWRQNLLNVNRLQQELAKAREERLKDGQDKES